MTQGNKHSSYNNMWPSSTLLMFLQPCPISFALILVWSVDDKCWGVCMCQFWTHMCSHKWRSEWLWWGYTGCRSRKKRRCILGKTSERWRHTERKNLVMAVNTSSGLPSFPSVSCSCWSRCCNCELSSIASLCSAATPLLSCITLPVHGSVSCRNTLPKCWSRHFVRVHTLL